MKRRTVGEDPDVGCWVLTTRVRRTSSGNRSSRPSVGAVDDERRRPRRARPSARNWYAGVEVQPTRPRGSRSGRHGVDVRHEPSSAPEPHGRLRFRAPSPGTTAAPRPAQHPVLVQPPLVRRPRRRPRAASRLMLPSCEGVDRPAGEEAAVLDPVRVERAPGRSTRSGCPATGTVPPSRSVGLRRRRPPPAVRRAGRRPPGRRTADDDPAVAVLVAAARAPGRRRRRRRSARARWCRSSMPSSAMP